MNSLSCVKKKLSDKSGKLYLDVTFLEGKLVTFNK